MVRPFTKKVALPLGVPKLFPLLVLTRNVAAQLWWSNRCLLRGLTIILCVRLYLYEYFLRAINKSCHRGALNVINENAAFVFPFHHEQQFASGKISIVKWLHLLDQHILGKICNPICNGRDLMSQKSQICIQIIFALE